MNYEGFNWLNKSHYEKKKNGIEIFAPENSDYFICPIENKATLTAPFLFKGISGDFVLRAKVSHDFSSQYAACGLLALDKNDLWVKACFEMSDFNTHTIVTVMTNRVSDDANGVNIDDKEIWLQLARKGNVFAVHYSNNGKEFKMARLTYMPMSSTIKVGLEAQSPVGAGGMRYFSDVVLESVTLMNIRNGNF